MLDSKMTLKNTSSKKLEICFPKFNVGEVVYYAIPENSDPGIVINTIYFTSEEKWKYKVAFALDLEPQIYTEQELSKTKVLV